MGKPTMKEIESLYEDRKVRAEAIFQEIQFPSSVEDYDGWDSYSGGHTKDKRFNTWSRTVYLRDEKNPEGDTKAATFSVVFWPGSCVPHEAYLDEKEMVLP